MGKLNEQFKQAQADLINDPVMAGLLGKKSEMGATLAAEQQRKEFERQRPTFMAASEFVKTFQGGGVGDTEKEMKKLNVDQLKELKNLNENFEDLKKALSSGAKGVATFGKRGAR